jgi:regulatory protein
MRPRKRWKKELSPSSNASTSEEGLNPPLSDQKLYALALKALSRRPYSTAELEKKLLDYSGDASALPVILRRLTANGYLNDKAYIEAFAHSRRGRKFQGRSRIENELRGKGLDPKLIREVLDKAYSESDDSELLKRALEKKLRSLSAPISAKKIARLYNYLFRQGFQAEAIYRELHERFDNYLDAE